MSAPRLASASRTTLITDQLNAEWQALADHAVPKRWRISGLASCHSLADVLSAIDWGRRHDPVAADLMLLDLLDQHTENGDALAGRLVLQAMLGRAVNLVRRTHRFGAAGVRGELHQLTAAAVAGLWSAIATYPVRRRRQKVAVNLCMETLRHFTEYLDDHAPRAVDGGAFEALEPMFGDRPPAPVVELLDTLTWGVAAGVITTDEATLLGRVYCPGPGQEGGAVAVARELGVTPTTVRQRCSRATQRLAAAVRAGRAGQRQAA